MALTYPVSSPHTASSGPSADPSKPGILQMLIRAVIESRHRRAEREIARYVAASGGFTDTIEREIEQRYLSKSQQLI